MNRYFPIWFVGIGMLALLIGGQGLRRGEFPMRIKGMEVPIGGAAGRMWSIMFLLGGVMMICVGVGIWVQS